MEFDGSLPSRWETFPRVAETFPNHAETFPDDAEALRAIFLLNL